MTDNTGTAAAHEAYSFACLRCGHGWEQSFDIEHHVDGSGETHVVYKADGRRVPSPLSEPTCPTCDGHVIRIMRAGRVAEMRRLTGAYGTARQDVTAASGAGHGRQGVVASGAGPAPEDVGMAPPAGGPQPWHLPDFLQRLFHHQRSVS